MTPPDDGGLVEAATKNWGWLVGLPGSGLGLYVLKLAGGRLKADQLTYCEAVEQIGLLADAVGGTIGRASSADADCDRCRAASTHRRRAGELIHELFPGDKGDAFGPRLKAINRALRDLEDAVHGASGVNVTDARDVAAAAIEELRLQFLRRTEGRFSLRLFGRRRGGKDA